MPRVPLAHGPGPWLDALADVVERTRGTLRRDKEATG
jgi:hypothetical protein